MQNLLAPAHDGTLRRGMWCAGRSRGVDSILIIDGLTAVARATPADGAQAR